MKRYFPLLLLLSGNFLFGQSVKDQFSERIFEDNFDNNSFQWPILTNKDNFFIIQNGEYFLKRSNEISSYVLLSKNPLKLSDYKIETEFKLNQSPLQESGLGLIFMIQENGKDAFVLEISDSKKYRIRQLSGETYHLLTGETNNGGWIKYSGLKVNGNYNKIKIIISKNVADIYFNEKFITTISDPTYKDGASGLIVGPHTEALVNYYFISARPTGKTELTPADGKILGEKKDSTIFYKEAYNKIKSENQQLKEEALITNTNMKLLEEEVQSISLKNDSLVKYIRKNRTALNKNASKPVELHPVKENNSSTEKPELVKQNSGKDSLQIVNSSEKNNSPSSLTPSEVRPSTPEPQPKENSQPVAIPVNSSVLSDTTKKMMPAMADSSKSPRK